MHRLRKIVIVLAVIAVLLIVVPLLIPVPPLADTVPAASLADADSEFVAAGGLVVHLKQAGAGEPVLLLLHGYGDALYTWDAVSAPLAELGRVVRYDRPAFGLTSRPLPGEWAEANPYATETQADLVVALLDGLGIERAVLVGNSAGGTIAALTAVQYPDRVQALVLVDAAIYAGGGTPPFARPLVQSPQLRRLGPLLARSFGDIGLAEAGKPDNIDNWDVAFWELVAASSSQEFGGSLAALPMPVLVVHGADDEIVPPAQSERLAAEISGATLAMLPECGHFPQKECPDALVAAMTPFLAELGR